MEEKKTQEKNKVLCLLQGMAAAYAVTCLVFLTYGIVLTYTNVSESTIPIVALVTTAISAGIAGFDFAKCIRQKGLLVGLGAGLIYAVLLYLITAFGSNDFSIQPSFWRMLAVSLAAGAAGGILGVNRKQS